MIKKIILLALAFLLLFSSKSYSQKEKYYLKLVNKVYDLTSYNNNGLYRHIYGVYREYLALTGGEYINLFPDNTFIISTFCDICREEPIARGTFSLSNGIVTFKYAQIEPEYSRIEYSINNLYAFWGWENNGTYVTGHITILVNENDLKKLNKEEQYFDFYERVSSYERWRDIKKYLNELK